jgi:hypothetical protein
MSLHLLLQADHDQSVQHEYEEQQTETERETVLLYSHPKGCISHMKEREREIIGVLEKKIEREREMDRDNNESGGDGREREIISVCYYVSTLT